MNRSELKTLIQSTIKEHSQDFTQKVLSQIDGSFKDDMTSTEMLCKVSAATSSVAMIYSVHVVFDILEQLGVICLDD